MSKKSQKQSKIHPNSKLPPCLLFCSQSFFYTLYRLRFQFLDFFLGNLCEQNLKWSNFFYQSDLSNKLKRCLGFWNRVELKVRRNFYIKSEDFTENCFSSVAIVIVNDPDLIIATLEYTEVVFLQKVTIPFRIFYFKKSQMRRTFSFIKNIDKLRAFFSKIFSQNRHKFISQKNVNIVIVIYKELSFYTR